MKTIIVLAFVAIAIQSCSTSKNLRKSERKKNNRKIKKRKKAKNGKG